MSTGNIKSDGYKQKIIIDKRGVPRIINSDALDIRTLLVLQMQNKQELIWISRPTTEIDCKMYLTSKSLYSYMYNYKYSHLIKRK